MTDKIAYSEFRQRLLRGGYHCTKIQLEGLYSRYMRDAAPVWVVECLQPVTVMPTMPTGSTNLEIEQRNQQILALLSDAPMTLDDIAPHVPIGREWLRRVMIQLSKAGAVIHWTAPVPMVAKNRNIVTHKKFYRANREQQPC